MKKIFIARKYVCLDGGSRHFYEEGAFTSYNSAYEFIVQISDEDNDCFLSEIVCFYIDDSKNFDKKDVFIFDRQGNLIVEEMNHCKEISFIEKATTYSEKYRIGDIVMIKAYPWNACSPAYIDTIGVISMTPVPLEDWIKDGNSPQDWDNEYVADCIRCGYIGHFHVQEKAMDLYTGVIPDRLKFIKILSDHYSKKKILPDTILNELIYGKIFIENVKHFDFNSL